MTATLGTFTAEQVAALMGPAPIVTWLARLHLVDGVLQLHPGYGNLTVAGQTYQGVTHPSAPILTAAMSEIQEPRVGVGSAITIELSGVSAEFRRSIKQDWLSMEGRQFELLFAIFDDDRTLIGSPVDMMPGATMTQPKFSSEAGTRRFSFTVESVWSALNFTPAGRLSPADQRRRAPGDTACDLVGSSRNERWPITQS